MALTLDPYAPGRQIGALRIAAPRPGEPGALVALPLAQLRGVHAASGPTVVLIADGAIPVATDALGRLARTLEPGAVHGTLRIVPTLAPLHDGTTADLLERGADMLADRVLADADLVIDLVGDDNERWRWGDLAQIEHGDGLRRDSAPLEAAMIAFGADWSLHLQCAPGPVGPLAWPDLCLDDTPRPAIRMPPSAERCVRLGIDRLCIRGHAGDTRRDRDNLETGCRNALIAHGLLDAPFTLRATRLLTAHAEQDQVRTPASGLLAPEVAPGRYVHAGDVLARLIDPAAPLREPRSLRATHDGVIAAVRRGGPVAAHDPIALLARPIQA